jgi:hypothetical protein
MEIILGIIGILGFLLILIFSLVAQPFLFLTKFINNRKYKKLLARMEGKVLLYISKPHQPEFIKREYRENWNSKLFNSIIKSIQKKALTIESVSVPATVWKSISYKFVCQGFSEIDNKLFSQINSSPLNNSFWLILKVENGELFKMELEKNIVELMKGKKDKKEILEEITEFIEH